MIDINDVCTIEDCDMRCGHDIHLSKDDDNPNVCVSCEG